MKPIDRIKDMIGKLKQLVAEDPSEDGLITLALLIVVVDELAEIREELRSLERRVDRLDESEGE